MLSTKHSYTSERQFTVRSQRLEYSLEFKISMSFALVTLGINKSNMNAAFWDLIFSILLCEIQTLIYLVRKFGLI